MSKFHGAGGFPSPRDYSLRAPPSTRTWDMTKRLESSAGPEPDWPRVRERHGALDSRSKGGPLRSGPIARNTKRRRLPPHSTTLREIQCQSAVRLPLLVRSGLAIQVTIAASDLPKARGVLREVSRRTPHSFEFCARNATRTPEWKAPSIAFDCRRTYTTLREIPHPGPRSAQVLDGRGSVGP